LFIFRFRLITFDIGLNKMEAKAERQKIKEQKMIIKLRNQCKILREIAQLVDKSQLII